MKFNRLLAAALAAVLVCLANSLPAWAQGTSRPPASQNTGTNVAVIDLQKVFSEHIRHKQNRDLLKKENDQAEAQFKLAQQDLAKMMEKLRELKPGTEAYKKVEIEAAQFESSLRTDVALKRKELTERSAKMMYQTYLEVTKSVERFSQENGIGLVLQFSSADIDPANPQSIGMGLNRPVVYQDRLDITNVVIQIVNRGSAPPPTNGAGPTAQRPVVPGSSGGTLRPGLK